MVISTACFKCCGEVSGLTWCPELCNGPLSLWCILLQLQLVKYSPVQGCYGKTGISRTVVRSPLASYCVTHHVLCFGNSQEWAIKTLGCRLALHMCMISIGLWASTWCHCKPAGSVANLCNLPYAKADHSKIILQRMQPSVRDVDSSIHWVRAEMFVKSF